MALDVDRHLEAQLRLLRFTSVLGTSFGTEDFSQFLHALVKMQRPEVVVELGTAAGPCALSMALAAEMNGRGHVYSVDDFELLRGNADALPAVLDALVLAGFGRIEAATPREYFDAVAAALGVDQRLTITERHIDLEDPAHFDDYPFAGQQVDLLFSDFRHGGTDVVEILTHFLPRMAPSSSVFIDSVPSSLASFLVVERLVSILNRGRTPEAFRKRWTPAQVADVAGRELRVVHLIEDKVRRQNGCVWIRSDPLDVYPPGWRG